MINEIDLGIMSIVKKQFLLRNKNSFTVKTKYYKILWQVNIYCKKRISEFYGTDVHFNTLIINHFFTFY